VLSVNSGSSHGERERDGLTSCSQVTIELRTRRRERRSNAANHHEKLGLDKFQVQVNFASPIGQVRVPIWRVITPTWGLPNPIWPVLPLISHNRSYPPHHSHFHPSFSLFLVHYSHRRTHSDVIPLYLSMPWSWVDTEYKHTLNTAYTMYSIPKIVCLPFILMITGWPLNVAWASGVPPYRIDCHQPAPHQSAQVKSPCHIPTFASQLTDEWSLSTRRAMHQAPPSGCRISLDRILRSLSPTSHDYGRQVRLIMASKCISQLARSRSRSASGSSLDFGLPVYLQIHSVTLCKCISTLTRFQTPSSHDHGLQVHLQPCSIMISECISKFTWSRPPSVSPNPLNFRLQVHHQTRSIMASKCISKYARSPPPGASINLISHVLGLYLQLRSITAFKFMSKRAQSRPRSVSRSSLDRHFQADLELLSSIACSQTRYTVCRWVAI